MYRLVCKSCGAIFHSSNPRKYCQYHTHRGPQPSATTQEILEEMRAQDAPAFSVLADKHGLSRQRISQIARRHGLGRREQRV